MYQGNKLVVVALRRRVQAMIMKVDGREKLELRQIFEGTCVDAKMLGTTNAINICIYDKTIVCFSIIERMLN
jgi:hypothetical protein